MKKNMLLAMIFYAIFTIFVASSQAADPYVIGFITDFTGAGKTMFGPEAEGFRVYFDNVNGKGGINGHPVKVIYEDDKSDPARSNSVATKLILEDNVLAIVGLGFSFTHKPVYRLAGEHGLPVITTYSCVAPIYDVINNPDVKNIFGTGQVYTPEYTTTTWMDLLSLSEIFPKGTTFGSMCYTSPGGRMISKSVADIGAQKYGWKLLYHEDIPPGTVDISPWAQKIADANPELLVCNFAEEIIIPMMAALEKFGYKGAIFLSDAVSVSGFKKAVDGLMKPKDNIYIQSYNELQTPFGDTPVAEYQEIAKIMKKYGHKFEWTNRQTNGWLAAMVVEDALKRVGWPADRSALIKALEGTNVDTKGLRAGPYQYSSTDHRGPEYGKLYRWDPKKKEMVTAVDWLTWRASEILKK